MATHKATPGRTAIRRARRLQRRVALLLLAGLFASGGVAMATLGTTPSAYGAAERFDEATAATSETLTRTPSSAAASRSGSRGMGSWSLGETIDGERLTGVQADNPVVQDLLNGRDRDAAPAGFDPNHATGDTGNAYEFSQCTWWVYKRRHELGLPAGSHMGNGNQWAASARSLGYWVDRTPRQGDVMVFAAGQDGNSPVYGHVAVVEKVDADGSIDTSECGSAYNGTPFTKHYTASAAAEHEFIHY